LNPFKKTGKVIGYQKTSLLSFPNLFFYTTKFLQNFNIKNKFLFLQGKTPSLKFNMADIGLNLKEIAKKVKSSE
jgi:hypothetical protein